MSHDSGMVETRCGLCQGTFPIARRRLRECRQRSKPPLCRVCRILARLERQAPPDALQYAGWWLKRIPAEELDLMLVGIFGYRAGTPEARARRRELREELVPAPVAA